MPDDTTTPDSGDAAEEDLRATTDSIQADLGRLATVEGDKSSRDAEDPQVDRLSDEAVELADRIGRQVRVERQLSDEIG
jgi:hypothetical protein